MNRISLNQRRFSGNALKALPGGDPGNILPLELIHWMNNVNTSDHQAVSQTPPLNLKAHTLSAAGGKPWLLADLAVRIKPRLLNVVSLHLREDATGERRNRNTREGIMESARDIR